jgi:hypothetical protein
VTELRFKACGLQCSICFRVRPERMAPNALPEKVSVPRAQKKFRGSGSQREAAAQRECHPATTPKIAVENPHSIPNLADGVCNRKQAVGNHAGFWEKHGGRSNMLRQFQSCGPYQCCGLCGMLDAAL